MILQEIPRDEEMQQCFFLRTVLISVDEYINFQLIK